ncbi:phage terminase large subunit family protein [Parvibaculum sp.]|uniref:phage terminase large subunit family protein n=1 Tax=Parvibaculum sp. TaxID=2024848 RepID=UPI0027320E73|nr:terminase gpA endonuclease subunit [Parvibaculum sp.]MDP1628847.1 phage terminase large subunit family protein [Parvibaculum sp.]MDP2148242.1 phage terminase large subunit family protein [Parvibaculum sp.]MDP3327854.1 phage terminase large subunit family protein [Parvibaculum sp.]
MLDLADFERRSAELADELLFEASAPPVRLDLVEWSQANVRVPDGPREGQLFDLTLTPYLEPILRRLSPEHPALRIYVRKSAQLGYTTALIAWMLAIIAHIGGRAMVVMPTLAAAGDFNEDKFQPALDACDDANSRVAPQRSRSGEGSKAKYKKFPGGSVRLTGANSSADLSSKTIKWIACDEVDRFPKDLDGQGSPMGMIDARQFAFIATADFKKLVGGTPTIEGSSEIDDGFERGSQCYWEVPCPHCGEFQDLEWEQLKWKEEWPHEAEIECACCGERIGHHEKERMVRAGRESQPRNPGAGKDWSYSLNALYSPFVTWDAFVAAYLEAKNDPLTLMVWTNLWRGRSFKLKGEAPGWRDLMERAQRVKVSLKGEIPDWVLFLTAGVDVQGNRIEIVIYGWGLGKTRVAIDHIVIEGDPNDLVIWGRLTEIWMAEYRTKSGSVRFIEMLAIDAGYLPDMVHNWVRGKESNVRGRPRAMAIRGTPRVTNWILGGATKTSFTLPGQTKRGTVMSWWVGSHIGKASFYGFLGLQGPNDAGQYPPGFVHFAADLPETFFQQATAETLKPVKKKNGTVDYQWQLPSGKRNEVLDCSVYAHAAAIALGMDRMTPQQWDALHQERTACAPDKGQLDLLSAVVAPPVKGGDEPPAKPQGSLAKRLA